MRNTAIVYGYLRDGKPLQVMIYINKCSKSVNLLVVTACFFMLNTYLQFALQRADLRWFWTWKQS